MTGSTLLDEQSVGAYLVARGTVAQTEGKVIARVLDGGISNVVILAATAVQRVVVKQSLPRLRVADEWLAKRERVLTEADALRLVGRLTPDGAPPVIDVDSERCIITIEAAPADSSPWKDHLMRGVVESDIGNRLGVMLGTWHSRTAASRRQLLPTFNDRDAFTQLRIDPYHRTVARREPDVANAVGAVVDAMDATRVCLVHGDFSPKNVLVGANVLWVIDFEVAHFGDPAFDLAFMLTHLVLKSVRRPSVADQYLQTATTFLESYYSEVDAGLVAEGTYLSGQLGSLLMARVIGKSPAQYLTAAQGDTVVKLGRQMLMNPPPDPLDVWMGIADV